MTAVTPAGAATDRLKGHLEEVTAPEGTTHRAPAGIVASGSAGLDAERRLAAPQATDSITTALMEENTHA